MSQITKAIIIALLLVGCVGCANLTSTGGNSHPPTNSFVEAVHLCRFWNGELIRRRLALNGATLNSCLRGLGWQTSGQPLKKTEPRCDQLSSKICDVD